MPHQIVNLVSTNHSTFDITQAAPFSGTSPLSRNVDATANCSDAGVSVITGIFKSEPHQKRETESVREVFSIERRPRQAPAAEYPTCKGGSS